MRAVIVFGLAASLGAPAPLVVEGARAPAYALPGGQGMVRLLLNAAQGANAALDVLTLVPGGEVRAHAHDSSSEILYIESGTVEMTLAGKPFRAGPGDAVFIPAGVTHSARAVS